MTLLMHSHSQLPARLCGSDRNILAGKHQCKPRTVQTLCCKSHQRTAMLDHHYNTAQGHTEICLIVYLLLMPLVLSRSQLEQARVHCCQQDNTCKVNTVARIE